MTESQIDFLENSKGKSINDLKMLNKKTDTYKENIY